MRLAVGIPRHARLRVSGSHVGLIYMVIGSDDVQNIRDHALVGKPSREFYVKLSEI